MNMPVGYPKNAFFYKGEWYNTDGEGVPATAVTNTLTGGSVIVGPNSTLELPPGDNTLPSGGGGGAVAPLTRAALKALNTSTDTTAYLKEAGREGQFVWRTGNYSTQIAADTAEGVYIKANDTASSSGAWVRVFSGEVRPEWFGAVGDGTTPDLTALQSAAAAAITARAKLRLSRDYSIASAWTLPAGLVVEGSGAGVTTLRGAASLDDYMVVLGDHCQFGRLRMVIPNTSTKDALRIHKMGATDGDIRGVVVHDLHMTGGNNATAYAISMTDSFSVALKNINIRTSMNGVRIANLDSLYNYGNSTVDRVEVSLTTAGRVGWDIYGLAGTKNYNLMSFNYISAVTGSGTGSTGIKIQNCGFLTFINADLEGCATSLYVEGSVGGGNGSQCNVFQNMYASGNVIVATGTFGTTFISGRVYGTYTDGGANTATLGLLDVNKNPISGLQTLVKTGPRFTPSGMSVQMRNQQGSTLPLGTIVRLAGVDWGAQKATETLKTWAGVVAADIAAGTNGDVVVSGVADILSTNAVARGDNIVLAGGVDDGLVKSIGTAAPAGAQILVGTAFETTGGAGVAAVLLHR
ncbi:MAG: hypothetical protein KDE20_24315, partial [Caldilineaceae bacterium]|nr:hypothetical protein [Caldilineaceae bacterium]